MQEDCSLDLNDLCSKLTFTICALKKNNTPRFEQILTLLKSNSCNCQLITQQFSMFSVSRHNVISNNKFPNVLFEKTYHFRVIIQFCVWTHSFWTLVPPFVCFLKWCFCKVCVFDNTFELLFETSYIFRWCYKFWKLIDTKGQIFNDL